MQELKNIHHLCAKSAGGSNAPENLRLMSITHHNALHALFLNRLPHQQLRRLADINQTVFTKEYSQAINEILEITEPGFIYKKGILRPQR